MTVWGKVGVTYARLSGEMTYVVQSSERSTSELRASQDVTTVGLDLEPTLIVAIVPHLGATLAGTLDAPLYGATGSGGGITLWLENVGVVIPGLGDLLAQFGLPPRLYPALSPVSALIGPGAIFLAILLGGVVPYLRVVRLTPALAMRSA